MSLALESEKKQYRRLASESLSSLVSIVVEKEDSVVEIGDEVDVQDNWDLLYLALVVLEKVSPSLCVLLNSQSEVIGLSVALMYRFDLRGCHRFLE